MGSLGKLLILLGVFIIVIGVLLLLGEKIPWLGRLPGDIIIRKKNFTFYPPAQRATVFRPWMNARGYPTKLRRSVVGYASEGSAR